MVDFTKALSVLDIVRTGLNWLAGLLSNFIDIPLENSLFIVSLIVSIYLGSRLFGLFFTEIKGRELVYWGIIAGIFYVLTFL